MGSLKPPIVGDEPPRNWIPCPEEITVQDLRIGGAKTTRGGGFNQFIREFLGADEEAELLQPVDGDHDF
jgi:hypothetical protein